MYVAQQVVLPMKKLTRLNMDSGREGKAVDFPEGNAVTLGDYKQTLSLHCFLPWQEWRQPREGLLMEMTAGASDGLSMLGYSTPVLPQLYSGPPKVKCSCFSCC